MKVYYVFSLESPHWGDPNEYTQYTLLPNYPKISPKQVPNNCYEVAISVPSTEGLPYIHKEQFLFPFASIPI